MVIKYKIGDISFNIINFLEIPFNRLGFRPKLIKPLIKNYYYEFLERIFYSSHQIYYR